MQTVRPAAAIHHATGEFIDDDDLAVFDDVISVPLAREIGDQRLIKVMDNLGVLDIIQIVCCKQALFDQQLFDFLQPVFGQLDAFDLFIDVEPFDRNFARHLIKRNVKLGLVLGRPGDDQRRARFVDQDRIDLIDNREIERALRHLAAFVLHVVAQVVETEFVVGAVGDIGAVGVTLGFFGHSGDNHPDTKAEPVVKPPHLRRIAPGKVIVHGDNVHALALDRVEIDRQRRHQGLAFTGAHFRDFTAVEHDPADQLHIKMPHPEHSHRCLANGGKCFGQNVVKLGAIIDQPAQFGGLSLQFSISQRLHLRFERVDLHDNLAQRFDVSVVGRTEHGFDDGVEHEKQTFDRVRPCNAGLNRVRESARLATGRSAKAKTMGEPGLFEGAFDPHQHRQAQRVRRGRTAGRGFNLTAFAQGRRRGLHCNAFAARCIVASGRSDA